MSNTQTMEVRPELLAETLVETLETMAFISVMPVEGATPMPDDPVLVSIRFDGAGQGVMDLATSSALGALLAENMLGPCEDIESAEQRSHDALKELLNVLCGAMLRSRTEAAGQIFEMNIPAASPIGLTTWQALVEDPQTLTLLAEGFPIAVRLRGEVQL